MNLLGSVENICSISLLFRTQVPYLLLKCFHDAIFSVYADFCFLSPKAVLNGSPPLNKLWSPLCWGYCVTLSIQISRMPV